MSKFQTNLPAIWDFISSTEGLVSVFGMLCLVAAVGFADATGRNIMAGWTYSPPAVEVPLADPQDSVRTRAPLESYSLIASRNIFGASKNTVTPQTTPVAQQPTTLKLRLVGTNIRSLGAPLAIIEDSSKKNQEVFALNELVFDQARLLEILSDKVRLDRNGKIEILELEEAVASSAGISPVDGAEPVIDDNQTQFDVPEAELENALANLPQLLSQARAVPYFRNGKSIGMRLFAIRRGSLYEKLGLKNGDILKAVNNNSLSDPTQALKLFEQLKTERNIGVKVERNGQDVDLSYSIN